MLGHHFFVKTDHCSLKHLLNQGITTNEQQLLLMKLLPFDFTIVYKSGKENRDADSNAELLALVMLVPMDFTNLEEVLLKDPYTTRLITSLKADPHSIPDFQLVNNKIFKNRLVIPVDLQLRQKLLAEAHDSFTDGHGGYLKTLQRLSANVFWPHMKKDVKQHAENCLVCQQNKYQTLAPAGLLQPLLILDQVWEDLLMDFISGLPKSNGFDTILVVVDRFSKYSHFIALSHPFTAKSVAKIFCKEIVRLHGVPHSIVSDRNTIFMSAFW